MIKKSKVKHYACLGAAAFVFMCAAATQASAQRDPFRKPGWATPKTQPPGGASAAKPKLPKDNVVAVNYGAPTIESRIEYFNRLRNAAAQSGQPLPKVTSVLTLNEMAVSGIFKTPRGWAAMVEATPIKLSYTIYPGEKFFDGQLVAIEENRLVFRKVTKVGEGKFVSSVENKPLRVYTAKAQAEGTAPAQAEQQAAPTQTASNAPAAGSTPGVSKPQSNPFLSPLDEMNRQPEPAKEEPAKAPAKKTTKVARIGDK